MFFVIEKSSLSVSHVEKIIGRDLAVKDVIFSFIVQGLLLANNLVLIIVKLNFINVDAATFSCHIHGRARGDISVSHFADRSRILNTLQEVVRTGWLDFHQRRIPLILTFNANYAPAEIHRTLYEEQKVKRGVKYKQSE